MHTQVRKGKQLKHEAGHYFLHSLAASQLDPGHRAVRPTRSNTQVDERRLGGGKWWFGTGFLIPPTNPSVDWVSAG